MRAMMKICWLAGLLCCGLAGAQNVTNYLVTTNENAQNPFTTWETAGTSVIDVVKAAMTNAAAPRIVWVSNGVYVLTNNVIITNDVTLKSVNGWETVILDGNNAYYFSIQHKDCVLDDLTITNCKNSGIIADSGAVSGGGIVTNCLITGGWTGVKISGNNSLCVVANSIIRGNTNSGIAFSSAGTGIVYNCLIESNYYNGHGGGIRIGGGVYPHATIRNCLIRYNSIAPDPANYYGAGIYFAAGCSNENVSVANCTIVNNYGGKNNGGITFLGPSTEGITNMVVNCIIVSNTKSSGAIGNIFINNDGQSQAVSFSCSTPYGSTKFTHGNRGNITNNPGFTDFDGGNYQFNRYSPCFNSGTNQTGWMNETTDLDGHARIIDGTVDMGAYELLLNMTVFSVQ